MQLRWTFRKLFGKRIKQALIGATEAAAKKRQRTDTPVREVTNPEKRAKSNPDQNREAEGATSGLSCADPRDLSARCQPQLEMIPAVRLERFKPLEKGDKVNRATEKQGDTTRSNTTGLEHAAKPQGLVKKTKSQPLKASGTSAKEIHPTEAVPPLEDETPTLESS